eukprot:2051676-Amphidinium_carterae.2
MPHKRTQSAARRSRLQGLAFALHEVGSGNRRGELASFERQHSRVICSRQVRAHWSEPKHQHTVFATPCREQPYVTHAAGARMLPTTSPDAAEYSTSAPA